MRTMLSSLSAIALLSLALSGCPSSPDPGAPAPDWGFVSGVLAANCAPCHTSGSGFPAADPMAEFGDPDAAYELLVGHPAAEAPGLNRVEPGDAENSYLIHKLEGSHLDVGGSGGQMPDGGPYLDDATIAAVREWVEAGASEVINGGDDDDATGDDDDATGDDDDATGDDDDSGGDDDDSSGDDDDSSPSPSTFSDVFSIILNQSCSCHAGASHSTGFAHAGDQATAYSVLVDVPSSEAPSLDRVEPGDLAASYLWNKVVGSQADVGGSGGQMPLGGSGLNVAELDVLESWILDGAQNN